MSIRSSVPILLLAWTAGTCEAQAIDRSGDTPQAIELDAHASAVAAIEHELLAVIDAAPADERFGLYWTYDALIGAWVQVEHVRLLMDAVHFAATSDAEQLAAQLRDQAQFTAREIDQVESQLAQQGALLDRPAALRINGDVRALLARIRETLARYGLAVTPPST